MVRVMLCLFLEVVNIPYFFQNMPNSLYFHVYSHPTLFFPWNRAQLRCQKQCQWHWKSMKTMKSIWWEKSWYKMRLLRRNLLVAFRLCIMCLCGCLIVVLFLTLFPLVEENTCHRSGSGAGSLSNVIASPALNNEDHFLCLIIPFRDRFEELNEFVPMISDYLNRQSIAHAIFVINQMDTLRFNRFVNCVFILSLRFQDILRLIQTRFFPLKNPVCNWIMSFPNKIVIENFGLYIVSWNFFIETQ